MYDDKLLVGRKVMGITMMQDISSATYTSEIAMVTVNNIPNNTANVAAILQEIADHSVVVDMISQTAPYKDKVNLSFTIPQDDLSLIVNCTAKFKELSPNISTDINGNNTKIMLAGEAMRQKSGVAARVMTAFAEAGIGIKLITTAEAEISCLIDIRDVEAAKKIFE